MADVISVKDPRGVHVTCSDSQWDQHIVLNHSIMADNMDAIICTLQDPDVINESHDSLPPLDYREIYTKKVKTATYYSRIPYTKVITSCIGGSAEIITAYPSKSITGGIMSDKEAIYVAEEDV